MVLKQTLATPPQALSNQYGGARAKVLLTALGRTFCHQSTCHDPLISLYCHKAVSKTLALAPP